MIDKEASTGDLLVSKRLVLAGLGVIGISSLLSVCSLGLLLYKPVDVNVSISNDDMAKLESRVMHSVDKMLVNYKELQETQLKRVLKDSERNFGIYSKEYVEILVENAADNLEMLMPKGSLAAIADKKMKSFLENEDLKNIQFAENHGVEVIEGDEQVNMEKLVQRLKKLVEKNRE